MAQTEFKWVSVDERLPTEQKDYFVAFRFTGDDKVYYSAHTFFPCDEKPHFQHEGYSGLKHLYWAETPPLPEKKPGLKLKPCPFCGGKPELRTSVSGCYTTCTHCGASTTLTCYKDNAADMWNRRGK
jgi:Lar family restriction alleviation protein